MSSKEKPDTFGARKAGAELDTAYGLYIAFNILLFIGLMILVVASISLKDRPKTKSSISVCERRIAPSPHEQQPEPIPAVTQGGLDVERWIL